MNQTQFQSFWNQLKAPLKNQWEKFTNEDLVQIQGDLATFNGKVEPVIAKRKTRSRSGQIDDMLIGQAGMRDMRTGNRSPE